MYCYNYYFGCFSCIISTGISTYITTAVVGNIADFVGVVYVCAGGDMNMATYWYK